MGFRTGPPKISAGKKFWPVQKAVYDIVPTMGEKGYYEKFSCWEAVDFYDTKEAAENALAKLRGQS